MKLHIYTLQDRFCFSILNDASKEIFSSSDDFYITPFVKSNYKYAWEACKDARNLLRNCSYHLDAHELLKTSRDEYDIQPKQEYNREDLTSPVAIDISADTMITDHYSQLLNIMNVRAKGAKGDKKESKNVYKMIKMIITELGAVEQKLTDGKEKIIIRGLIKKYKRLLRKYFIDKGIKTAQVIDDESDSDLKEDVLEDYAEKICKSVQENHPGAIYEIEGENKIAIFEPQKSWPHSILEITINDDLNVDGIFPRGYLRKLYPLHSSEFYQKYWKPIVEAVGHIYIDDMSLLMVPEKSHLPDIPNGEKNYTLTAWNKNRKTTENIDISFRGKKPIWVFQSSKTDRLASVKNVSKYTEQDYVNAIVKCISPELKSLYGRTGEVIEIIPHEDYVEISVNFGRGLGIVRVNESNLEIVSPE